MRFLVLQDKETPTWAYSEVEKQAALHNHKLVKWTAELVAGKDYDGILAFPRPSNIADVLCYDRAEKDNDADYNPDEDDDNDLHTDDTEVTIGKGIYMGLMQGLKHTYVVLYDTDLYRSPSPDTILLALNWKLDKHRSESDFSQWADMDLKDAVVSLLAKGFKILNEGERGLTAFNTPSGEMNTCQLLLLRRRRR